MQSVNRVIKFIWILSLLLFLAGLLYGYYYLPDAVCINFDRYGNPIDYIERKSAFYLFAGIAGLFNLLFIVLEKVILTIPDSYKPVPNKNYWLQNEETKLGLNYALSDWVYSFAAILNTSFLAFYYAFIKVNSNFQSNINQYNWLFKLIMVLLALWLIYLPVRLFIKKIFIR